MKTSIRSLGIIVVSIFGFLIILTFYTEKNQLELTSQQMHEKMTSQIYLLDSSKVNTLNDPMWISLNKEDMFLKNDSDEAINIPLPDLLSEEYNEIWKNKKPKILFSADNISSFQAWSLLTQMGYTDIYVMKSM